MVVLYRCVCSRNYAEWRSSCFPERNQQIYTHVNSLLFFKIGLCVQNNQLLENTSLPEQPKDFSDESFSKILNKIKKNL